MVMAQPHFLLFCDTHTSPAAEHGQQVAAGVPLRTCISGRWHFVLEQLDGTERLEVADSERVVNQERLALLSVVRGLEALPQPSRVTLVTTSRYVARGLRYGLSTWRKAEYKWERFGERIPIRNADLWQRIDGALQFHGVTCRLIQSEVQSASHGSGADASRVPRPEGHSAIADNTSPAAATWSEAAARTADPHLSPRATMPRSTSPQPVYAGEHTHFLPSGIHLFWHQLIQGWVRWWRNRWHANPALFGG